MDYSTYEVEAKVEAAHWWFVGRRYLFGQIITDLNLTRAANILDIGTSTGTNLRMLRDLGFANVRGLDFHDEAIRWCLEKSLGAVDKGDICAIPSEDNAYDFVLATDIIEHVDDDIKALTEVYRVLKAGGYALVTVPAFQSLWGVQDEVSQHKRRYKRDELITKINIAGFEIVESCYFNYWLFLPIWIVRRIIHLMGIKIKSENELNGYLINKVLTNLFIFDVVTSRKLNVPFGVSVLAVVRK